MKFVTFSGLLAGVYAQQAAKCDYQNLKCDSALYCLLLLTVGRFLLLFDYHELTSCWTAARLYIWQYLTAYPRLPASS